MAEITCFKKEVPKEPRFGKSENALRSPVGLHLLRKKICWEALAKLQALRLNLEAQEE